MLRQEFVIVGYIPSTAAPGTVGALLLGYYKDAKLHYAGRVGTGYSGAESRALRDALEKISASKPALVNALPAGAEKGVRWATPQLVCEVEFRAWSRDRLILNSSFKGLREDEPAADVTLEIAPAAASEAEEADLAGVRLTHPERILWEEAGITKLGLAEFYSEIADWILPHVTERPLSLLRSPSGVGEKSFFAKHPWHSLGEGIRRVDTGDPYKEQVQDQWNSNPVGTHYARAAEPHTREWFEEVEAYRYGEYGPWMPILMEFDRHGGQDVLEIGGGVGTDLSRFARHGAPLVHSDAGPTNGTVCPVTTALGAGLLLTNW